MSTFEPTDKFFDALASQDLRALLKSPDYDDRAKQFMCGYAAYEANQKVLAYNIFKELFQSHAYPAASYYAFLRCMVDLGRVQEAITLLTSGKFLLKAGRYFIPFLRTHGAHDLATYFEEGWKEFFRAYMTEQSEGSSHGFQVYLDWDEDGLAEFFEPVLRLSDPISSVMDIGCNLGAMLDFLRRKTNIRHFVGNEINLPAVNEFERRYPETWALTTMYPGDMTPILPKIGDRSVDVVYTNRVFSSVPDADAIRHAARIAAKYVYLAETDHINLCLLPTGVVFHDYERLMGESGFDLVHIHERPTKHYDTIKRFRLFKRRGL